MGWLFSSPVESAEQYVRQCERSLAAQKANRDSAKKNGSYQKASKNYRMGDKVGTVYDYNVWNATEHLKKAKAKLAEAKKKK